MQGKALEAYGQFERVLEIDPAHAMALANSAVYMIQREDSPAAIGFLRRALEVEPDLPNGRFQLGRLLESTGQKTEAIAEYEKILRENPEDIKAAGRLMELTSGG